MGHGHQRIPDRSSLPRIDLHRGHQIQQFVTGQRGQVHSGQRLPGRGKATERVLNPGLRIVEHVFGSIRSVCQSIENPQAQQAIPPMRRE